MEAYFKEEVLCLLARFSLLGDGESPPPVTQNLLIPLPGKVPIIDSPLPDLYLRLPMINSPTKQQLTCYIA